MAILALSRCSNCDDAWFFVTARKGLKFAKRAPLLALFRGQA